VKQISSWNIQTETVTCCQNKTNKKCVLTNCDCMIKKTRFTYTVLAVFSRDWSEFSFDSVLLYTEIFIYIHIKVFICVYHESIGYIYKSGLFLYRICFINFLLSQIVFVLLSPGDCDMKIFFVLNIEELVYENHD